MPIYLSDSEHAVLNHSCRSGTAWKIVKDDAKHALYFYTSVLASIVITLQCVMNVCIKILYVMCMCVCN